MAGRFPVCEQVCGVGQDLVNKGYTARAEIGNRIKTLMAKWKQLQDLAAARRTKLEDSVEAHQVLCRKCLNVSCPSLFLSMEFWTSFKHFNCQTGLWLTLEGLKATLSFSPL